MKKNLSATGFDTLCIHGGHREDGNRAHLTPIYASSTYTYDSAEQAVAVFRGEEEAYIYGRFGSPTTREAEEKVAALEAFNLKDEAGNPLQLQAILHSSGMAAVSTMLLANLKSGDKIISHQSLYGGTQELIQKVLPGLGIGLVVVDFHDADSVAKAILADKAIKLMYIETPANPTLSCVDGAKLTQLGKAHSLIVCADNTFATPYLQQPFAWGVDYVMHSTTKFMNGHGTAIGGILVGRNNEIFKTTVTKTYRLLGGNSNGFDAFLLVNGLRTLGLRMERHCSNAQQVADFLQQHPAVAKVNYPGLKDHPDYAIAQQQMKQPGAMMSFELKGGYEAGMVFMNRLQLCTNAVSLGTCDTLLSHPASTTHVGVPRELRLQYGITDGLIRASIGIENAADIINDMKHAMA